MVCAWLVKCDQSWLILPTSTRIFVMTYYDIHDFIHIDFYLKTFRNENLVGIM